MKSKVSSVHSAVADKTASVAVAPELRKARWRLALAWISLSAIFWLFWGSYKEAYEKRLEAAERAHVHGR